MKITPISPEFVVETSDVDIQHLSNMGRLTDAQKARLRNRYVTQLSNILVAGRPIGGLGNAEAK